MRLTQRSNLVTMGVTLGREDAMDPRRIDIPQETPAETRWRMDWEEYAQMVEQASKMPVATVLELRETLSEIRSLPEVAA